MDTATKLTGADIIRRYAADIAYVAEETPAADLDGFISHLDTATRNFDLAGINGNEDLETASTLLAEAQEAGDDSERAVFLKRADDLLTLVSDMTQEYREMVGA